MKATLLTILFALILGPMTAKAGVFLFADSQENPLLITHPAGYTGGDNQHLEISVCINPNSEITSELEIPVQNAITIWNELQPTLGNVIQPNPELDFNAFDVESVILHEIGHCIGLAHPNLGSESLLPATEVRHFAKALPEFPTQPDPIDRYNLDAGDDNVIGTRDDQRGGMRISTGFSPGSTIPSACPR